MAYETVLSDPGKRRPATTTATAPRKRHRRRAATRSAGSRVAGWATFSTPSSAATLGRRHGNSDVAGPPGSARRRPRGGRSTSPFAGGRLRHPGAGHRAHRGRPLRTTARPPAPRPAARPRPAPTAGAAARCAGCASRCSARWSPPAPCPAVPRGAGTVVIAESPCPAPAGARGAAPRSAPTPSTCPPASTPGPPCASTVGARSAPGVAGWATCTSTSGSGPTSASRATATTWPTSCTCPWPRPRSARHIWLFEHPRRRRGPGRPPWRHADGAGCSGLRGAAVSRTCRAGAGATCSCRWWSSTPDRPRPRGRGRRAAPVHFAAAAGRRRRPRGLRQRPAVTSRSARRSSQALVAATYRSPRPSEIPSGRDGTARLRRRSGSPRAGRRRPPPPGPAVLRLRAGDGLTRSCVGDGRRLGQLAMPARMGLGRPPRPTGAIELASAPWPARRRRCSASWPSPWSRAGARS